MGQFCDEYRPGCDLYQNAMPHFRKSDGSDRASKLVSPLLSSDARMPISKPIARVALRGDVPRDLFWMLPLLKLDPFGAGGLDADLVVSFSAFESERQTKDQSGWLLGLRRGGLGPIITDRSFRCDNTYVAASFILSRAAGLSEPLLIASRETFARIREAIAIAPTFNVLIEGEIGNGKRLLAELIHRSSRSRHELLRVNCAVPEEVEVELHCAERELTNASQASRTVVLERISEMTMEHQARLTDVLARSSVRYLATMKPRLGESSGDGAISAMLAGHFPIKVKIAPLHQKSGDLVMLARHFLRMTNPRLNFDLTATSMLRNYRFPGNVRELRNLITRLDIYERDLPTQMIRGEQVERLLAPFSRTLELMPIRVAPIELAHRSRRERPHLRLVTNH